MAVSGVPEWARREYLGGPRSGLTRRVPCDYLAEAARALPRPAADATRAARGLCPHYNSPATCPYGECAVANGVAAAKAAAKAARAAAAAAKAAAAPQESRRRWCSSFLQQIGLRLQVSGVERTECAQCGAKFGSRNQLFGHLRARGHCVFVFARGPLRLRTRQLFAAVCECDAGAVERLVAAGACGDGVHHRLESGHGLIELAGVAYYGGRDRTAARRILDVLVAAGCTPAPTADQRRAWSAGWLRQWGLSAGPDELAAGPLAAAKADSNLWLVLRLLGEPDGPRRRCDHCQEPDLLCDSYRWTTFACGCHVCVESAAGWLRAQVEGGATGADVTCVACGDRLAWSEALGVADAATAERLERQTLELAVSQMDDFCWCPKCPSGGAVKPMTPKCNTTAVQCLDCGAKFCRHCKMLAKYHRMDGWVAHADGHLTQGQWLSCAEAKALGKAKAEAATEAFLAEKTKDCPKCGTKLMHDGGCSHMQCRQCHHEFCWLCLKPYCGQYTFNVTPGSTCPCGR